MAKPQLALIEKLVKTAKEYKKNGLKPDVIMDYLDLNLMTVQGYSRQTRQDYLKIVRARVWGHI